MRLFLLFIFFFQIATAEYILKEGNRPKSRLNRLPRNSFADMKTIPQDVSFYAKQVEPMSRSRQKRYNRDFNIKYFVPWNLRRVNISKKFLGWEIRLIKRRKIYDIRGKKIPYRRIKWWIKNSNFKKLDSVRAKAITIKHTNLKAIPTYNSFYLSNKKYENYFNFNQNSALYPNTPLYISHYSRDKKWAYVIAPYSFGWVSRKAIAVVDKKFIKKFKNNNYSIAVKDNLRIYNGNKLHSIVKLGTLFPMIDDDINRLMIATKGKGGRAVISTLKVATNKRVVARKPLKFNAKNVAMVAKEFVGEPYGWGGSYYARDCSATTRDFFAPFGIFLSRNSAAQAREGRVLKIPKRGYLKRKRFILRHAKAFRTLLFVPGHISLYLGQYRGEPIIMHTYWGVRKNNMSKIITARTIISTLELGKERKDTRVKSRLIYTLKSLVTF